MMLRDHEVLAELERAEREHRVAMERLGRHPHSTSAHRAAQEAQRALMAAQRIVRSYDENESLSRATPMPTSSAATA